MRHEYNETPIPNAFIDRYMMKANPVYALIYIYGMRLCAGGGGGLSSSELAESLNILESDVENAWRYWEKQGLVQIGGSNSEMDIVFLAIPSKQKKTESRPLTMPEKQPVYGVEELEIYQKQSRDIKNLFKHAEQEMGKLLTYNDLNVIFGFYDWLRLPADVIERLFTYCADNGHRDLRYIEKAAVDWAEHGIDSVEKAEAHVRSFNHDYKDIMRALGGGGSPSASQKRYIDKWLNTFNMPVDVIQEACDISALQIGRPKIAYVDKILEDWNKKNIRAVEDIKRERIAFSANRKPGAGRPEKKNRFVNFNQRDIDFEELERLELEQLKLSVK
ncbi:MAG: DnaD domain protein, partial [Clostridiales bacterium]|jgi:DnaD/phage-associated family protein|nr:DnaD domain protein [Clostridiales bacterium]